MFTKVSTAFQEWQSHFAEPQSPPPGPWSSCVPVVQSRAVPSVYCHHPDHQWTDSRWKQTELKLGAGRGGISGCAVSCDFTRTACHSLEVRQSIWLRGSRGIEQGKWRKTWFVLGKQEQKTQPCLREQGLVLLFLDLQWGSKPQLRIWLEQAGSWGREGAGLGFNLAKGDYKEERDWGLAFTSNVGFQDNQRPPVRPY